MKRKQKSLTETPEEKEKQLIARHEYEKRRRVNGSEESRDKRLAQQNREKKRANKSSESGKKRSMELCSHRPTFMVWTFGAGRATLKLRSHY